MLDTKSGSIQNMDEPRYVFMYAMSPNNNIESGKNSVMCC
ncbi:hypothetical protein BN938_0006 [Mucinivorans hirudinis]|uniref:Uncharacterized protein n=1 Tax=Mucinivorans hirudinis TaxID=1433126 RepID=A0A060R8N5_9BACT|nr:hypothetical protein BN938_0006 [Mucinivorans hirudinis]